LPKSCRVCDEFVNTSLSLRLLVAKSEFYLFVYSSSSSSSSFGVCVFLVVMFMSCNL
jgi:ABC-type lipoprotein release transport system permease subunit